MKTYRDTCPASEPNSPTQPKVNCQSPLPLPDLNLQGTHFKAIQEHFGYFQSKTTKYPVALPLVHVTAVERITKVL